MVGTRAISVSTAAGIQLVDITDDVEAVLSDIGISSGIVHLFSPHSTSAVIVNENESGLVSDLAKEIGAIVDWNKRYAHNRIDHNAPSHITGAFIGPSEVVPLTGGRLGLGTWQSVFFVELDGPRERRLVVTVVGE
ncbi:MAG: secondary thiamine-phosphate synthase enzyme YjbQ [Candidatus Aquicultorales bacterium]